MENLFISFTSKNIVSVTRYTSLCAESSPRHTHNFFEILIPLTGQAENIYGGASHSLCPGDVVLMRPGDAHELRILSAREKHTHRDIYVSPEKMQKICSMFPHLYHRLLAFREPVVFRVDLQRLRVLEQQLALFDQKSIELTDYDSFHTCIVFEILSYYMEYQCKQYEVLPGWLQNFLLRLNDIDYLSMKVKDLAKAVNYSPEHLCREFKKYMGKPLEKYLTESRVNCSLSLLAETDMPIVEISACLGYDSQNSFTRNFCNRLGVTPRAWRTEHKNTSSARHLKLF